MLLDAVIVLVGTAMLLVMSYRFRGRYGKMTGMVMAMTVGMMSGTLYGLLFGVLFAHNLTLSTMLGMVCGLFLGYGMGVCTSVLASLEGMMAGLMGGMMGAMLGCMLSDAQAMVWFFNAVYAAVGIVLFQLMRGRRINQDETEQHHTKWRWYDLVIAISVIGLMFGVVWYTRAGLF